MGRGAVDRWILCGDGRRKRRKGSDFEIRGTAGEEERGSRWTT